MRRNQRLVREVDESFLNGLLALSPASRARKSLALLDLGLPPQAVCFHLLRRLHVERQRANYAFQPITA
jgi:hypothetical protein